MSLFEELECTHGMPTPASCVDCMFEGPVAKPTPQPTVVITFTAHYDSWCPACHERIDANQDRISELSDGTYVHEDCAA